MKKISVAAIGECMIELSRRDGAWDLRFSGDTFNTLWAMRALLPEDAVTDFVSAFGHDPFSQDQIAFMAKSGIGTAASPLIDDAHPGLYAIALKDGERSFTYWRSQSVARRLADSPDLLRQSLSGRDLVYLSGISLAILDPAARAILIAEVARARTQGAKIAFDPNYRPRLWPSIPVARQAMAEMLPLADIVLPTFDDEALLYGDTGPRQTVNRLVAAGMFEIVVKDGAKDCLINDHGRQVRIPAQSVGQPLDTTGAGDAFNGGYLAARLSDQAPEQAAVWAHAVAARTVLARGALASPSDLRAAAMELPRLENGRR